MDSTISTEDYFDPGVPDLNIRYFKNFLSEEEATYLFRELMNKISWQQHYVKIFGKTLPQPRLSAFYAETEVPYTYSGLTLTPLPFLKEMENLQKKLLLVSPVRFTHCLANLYRDGKDSMGVHSDDEKILGKDPVIASLSFGEIRKFRMKHKFEKELKLEIDLEPGRLLMMEGKTQHYWKHELPGTSKPKGPRINLTFRKIENKGK